MDIQKLEQIVLNDVKADAQNLIRDTKKELDQWLKEQTHKLREDHKEELDRIKSDHESKLSTLKSTLGADFHKSLVKAKTEKNAYLKKELIKTLLEKVEKTPTWILEKAFSEVPIQSGKIMISEDLAPYLNQEKVEHFLKKYPGFAWGGIEKDIEYGITFELNAIRYLLPLSEIVDHFMDSQSNKIVSTLYP